MLSKAFEVVVLFLIDSLQSHLRKLFAHLAFAFIGLALSMTSFIITYFNLLNQYDLIGSVKLQAVSVGGAVLFTIGLAILWKASFSMRGKAAPVEQKGPTVSAIELAISALILDFVKERELDRELKLSQTPSQ